MPEEYYKRSDLRHLKKHKELAAQTYQAFLNFDQAAMADGALPRKTKELIAIAVAHTTQCPYCIDIHTRSAKKAGVTAQEIAETIWVAAALRAGAAYAHSSQALMVYEEDAPPK